MNEGPVHVYVAAPLPVRVTLLPEHIVAELAVAVSDGTIPNIVVIEAVEVQPPVPVTVTVCTPEVFMQTVEDVDPLLHK